MRTVPVEPADRAMRPLVLETAPPLVMFSEPLPELPTARTLLLVHVDPAPSTVAVPVEPVLAPRLALKFETVAPAVMLGAHRTKVAHGKVAAV